MTYKMMCSTNAKSRWIIDLISKVMGLWSFVSPDAIHFLVWDTPCCKCQEAELDNMFAKEQDLFSWVGWSLAFAPICGYLINNYLYTYLSIPHRTFTYYICAYFLNQSHHLITALSSVSFKCGSVVGLTSFFQQWDPPVWLGSHRQ